MTEMITGYQWGDNQSYIGPYSFANNLDKDEIHLPPKTTLKAPPTGLPVDQEAAWDGADWIVRNVAPSWAIAPPAGVVNGN
jgi:hypothetical protein